MEKKRTRNHKGGGWLVLVRHGRAGGNARHILNGTRRNPPLTKMGNRQARTLAAGWKEQPGVILSSPMLRARQTARFFEKKFHLKAIVVPKITEQDCGNWTGRSMLKLVKAHPERFFKYEDGRTTHFLDTVPGGESWNGVKTRAGWFLAHVRKEYAGQKVVAVSHGVFIIACVSLLTGIKPPRLWECRLKNADWVRFET